MKKNLLILIGIAAMFISENALSQSTKNLKEHFKLENYDQLMARITPKTDIYRPGAAHNFNWQSATNQWQNVDSSYFTYDCDGYVTQILSRNNGINTSLERFTYHPNKFLASWLTQYFDPISLDTINSSRYTFEIDSTTNQITTVETEEFFDFYSQAWRINFSRIQILTKDANNNIIEQLIQDFNTANLMYEDAYKYECNFVGNLLTEVYGFNSDGLNLNLESKTEFQYQNNLELTRTDFIWDGTQFIPKFRALDKQWENWNLPGGELSLASLISQVWDVSGWKNVYKFSAVPQPFGGWIETFKKYENGNWIDSSRYIITYDSHLNIIRQTTEELLNSVWVIKYDYEDIYTYDANDNTTQHIVKYWNQSINAAEYTRRYDYGDFKMCYDATAGTEEISMLNASVYPNPFDNSCTISVENEGNYIFHLVNLNGQVVDKESFTSTLTFHKNDLKPGIYIYTISSDKGNVKNGKLIIE